MSLYAVKNNKGEWLDGACFSGDFGPIATTAPSRGEAERAAEMSGGIMVELIEKPEPVVVSEEEAEMLDTLSNGELMPICELSYYVHHAESLSEKEAVKREDRLMRAYVNGWTVEQPKRYLIKVPHTDDSYFYKIDDEYCNAGDSYHLEAMTDKKWCTAAEIEHYGLQDCEKVVVTDSAKTTGEEDYD